MGQSHRRLVYLVAHLLALSLASSARAADDDILDDLDSKKPDKKEEAPATSADDDAEVRAATKGAKSEDAAKADDKAKKKDSEQVSPAALDKIKAVPRKQMLKHGRVEITPLFSASLNDAYYQHLIAGGSVIFYLHDSFGIGVGAEWLYGHIKNDSLDTVRTTLTSVPAVFEQPDFFAHIDAYWVPIYGKLSLFNSAILQFDLYAVAGMGAALVGDRKPPLASIGVGQRFVLADWLALRFEVRDHMFLDSQLVTQANVEIPRSDVQNYVLFFAGVSFFIPPSFDYGY